MNEEVLSAHHGDSLIDAVADWLMGQALGITGFEDLLRECSLRLNAAGVPLWRSTIAFQTLHRLYQAMSLVWYRDSGLHVGDVMYGNIGVPERVEFSVIGPAANEAARIETLARTTDCRMLASDHFTPGGTALAVPRPAPVARRRPADGSLYPG